MDCIIFISSLFSASGFKNLKITSDLGIDSFKSGMGDFIFMIAAAKFIQNYGECRENSANILLKYFSELIYCLKS